MNNISINVQKFDFLLVPGSHFTRSLPLPVLTLFYRIILFQTWITCDARQTFAGMEPSGAVVSTIA